MKFEPKLERVTLIKRYKRFLGDVTFADGTTLTVHTPNTGSMLGCADPGSFIWIRNTGNPSRKYIYAWELSETPEGILIGVNTGLANHLTREAIENGTAIGLQGYDRIRTEVKYGKENSRIDLLLESDNPQIQPCYVEVKNVTARDGDYAIFPDAVTKRGQKHLRELEHMVAKGNRAAIFFCIQRGDINKFRAAEEIDPVYAETLRQVVENGVEVYACMADITPEAITLSTHIEVTI